MSHDTHAIKLTFKTMIAWFTTLIHTLNWIKSFNFIDNLPYFFTKISNSRRRISLLEFPIICKRLRKWNWEQNSRPAWHFPSPISLGRRKRVPESRELLMLFCHALLSLKVRAQTQHVGLHDAVENILNFIEWEETPHSRNPHGCNRKLQTNYARSINFPSASVLLYIWDVCTVRAQTMSTHREMTIWSSVQQCDELDLACCVCMWWVFSILSQISWHMRAMFSFLTTVWRRRFCLWKIPKFHLISDRSTSLYGWNIDLCLWETHRMWRKHGYDLIGIGWISVKRMKNENWMSKYLVDIWRTTCTCENSSETLCVMNEMHFIIKFLVGIEWKIVRPSSCRSILT